MLKEFREFALKGNVLDLAVGIIIGAAFTAIVNSLVEDLIMPPVGVLLGGVDFSDWYLQLTNRDQTYPSLQAARAAGAGVFSFWVFSACCRYSLAIVLKVTAARACRSRFSAW